MATEPTLEIRIENNRGAWSIEVLDDSTKVHRQQVPAVLGLAMSALPAFKRTPHSTSQHNRWTSDYPRNEDTDA